MIKFAWLLHPRIINRIDLIIIPIGDYLHCSKMCRVQEVAVWAGGCGCSRSSGSSYLVAHVW